MVNRKLPVITPDQVRWFRLRRSGLVKPFGSPEAAARVLVGIQAQILPAAGLALWNRTSGLTNAQFEKLLYTKRTLVKLWGQRNTLHIYASSDWPLLYSARSLTDLTWWERQAQNNQSKVEDYSHLLEEIVALLRSRESMGRNDLRASGIDLHEELFSPWGGIFADLVRQGYACHAGRVGNEGHFAHRERWLPDLVWEPPLPVEANREIAERFFVAYGPATVQDFLYWRSIARATVADSLKLLEPALTEVEVEGKSLVVRRQDLATLRRRPPDPEGWPVRLLYRFDPYVLAHKDKGWVVDSVYYKAVWRPAGHIEGIVLAHGRGVGVWRYDRKGKGLVVTVTPFAPLPAYVTAQLPSLAEQVAGFLGLPLVGLEFRQIV
jgi:hypothetical protein